MDYVLTAGLKHKPFNSAVADCGNTRSDLLRPGIMLWSDNMKLGYKISGRPPQYARRAYVSRPGTTNTVERQTALKNAAHVLGDKLPAASVYDDCGRVRKPSKNLLQTRYIAALTRLASETSSPHVGEIIGAATAIMGEYAHMAEYAREFLHPDGSLKAWRDPARVHLGAAKAWNVEEFSPRFADIAHSTRPSDRVYTTGEDECNEFLTELRRYNDSWRRVKELTRNQRGISAAQSETVRRLTNLVAEYERMLGG